MTTLKARLQSAGLAGAALLLTTTALADRGQAGHEIVVDDPRPLAAALEVLGRAHCWVVTYEDPPYEYALDIRDVTRDVRVDFDAAKPRVLVPNGRAWTFFHARTDPEAPLEPGRVLRTLLDAYHASGNPGVFGLVESAAAWHVVPAKSHDVAGVLQPRTSLLAARIVLEPRDDTVLERVREILRAVSDATDRHVFLGTAPFNLMSQSRVRPERGPAGDLAREMLMQALAATNRPLAWQLLCQPGTSMCALNVQVVCDPAAVARD